MPNKSYLKRIANHPRVKVVASTRHNSKEQFSFTALAAFFAGSFYFAGLLLWQLFAAS